MTTFKNLPLDTHILLSDISNTVLSSMSLEDILQISIDKIVDNFGYVGGVLLLIDKNRLYAKTIAGGENAKKLLKMIGKPLKILNLPLNKSSNNLIVESIINEEVKTAPCLSSLLKEVIKESVGKKVSRLLGIKCCISLPLLYKKNVVGAFAFASKNESFSSELPILNLLSNHIAIAIVNARLFNENKMQIEKLREAYIKVQSAEKIKSNLLSMVSHELGTPISIIKGVLYQFDKLNTEDKLSKKEIELGNTIVKVINQFKELIQNINETLEIVNGNMEISKTNFDLIELIKYVITRKEKEAAKNEIDLVFHNNHQSNKLVIYADKRKIQYVLWEILTNALKFTNPKGHIEILLEDGDKNKVLLKVKDTGVGMSKEFQKNLFRKYFNLETDILNKKINGFGLGLYLVKKILDEHKTSINVSSKLGEGTMIEIELPINSKR
ncbi:hypothetical protein GF362_07075 [Candidatus Dojkabacteria bacterium]|nr:hypothetical protein [Candidatus Dojkabacteria bacterium]